MATPRSIKEYLEQLQLALKDADPAMQQDAQYDAEEYLRSELAEHPEWDEATMLANVATSYGAPEEVGALCAFICSSHSGFTTGQNFLIDGGSYPGTF